MLDTTEWLNWTEMPGIWLNIILGVPVVFLDEIDIWIGRLIKQVTLKNVNMHYPMCKGLNRRKKV